MQKKLICFFSTLCLTLPAFANVEHIFGDDNRKSVYEVRDNLLKNAARATVMAVDKSYLQPLDNVGSKFKIFGYSYKKANKVCPGVKFEDETATAFCSGFLVGPQTIITAGHCIGNDPANFCKDNTFVFDFGNFNGPKDLNFQKTGRDGWFLTGKVFTQNREIYNCEKVLTYKNSSNHDYAIIKLKHAVIDRVPMDYRSSGVVETRSQVATIGFPSGLPMKVADEGRVIRHYGESTFSTSLDTFPGNSGGPVINQKTGIIEGIHVTGSVTTYIPGNSDCSVLAQSPEFGAQVSYAGETKITLISSIITDILNGKEPSPIPEPEPTPTPKPKEPSSGSWGGRSKLSPVSEDGLNYPEKIPVVY